MLAAVANAVYDAIGVRMNALPISPPRVRFAIKQLQEETARAEMGGAGLKGATAEKP